VELHDRKQLDRVDAQVREVLHPLQGIEERGDPIGLGVLPGIVARREHPDVELVVARSLNAGGRNPASCQGYDAWSRTTQRYSG
jgi:hypothetical protein